MEKTRSLIVGATGLVGGEILKILESQNQNISLDCQSIVRLNMPKLALFN